MADIYITGSDQVWAQLISDKNNRAYFLDFGNKSIKRIAYAPSFAMESYPQDLIPELSHLLKTFDAVSVRENIGIDICKAAGRNDAKVVLDPTLLLDGRVYKDLFIKQDKLEHEYIFIYSLNILSKEEMEWEFLKQYAKDSNLDILVTPSSGVYPAKELFEEVTYSYCTIEKWLSNIAYSKLTVTTSFHGIVFCILLNKNFVYIPLKNSFKRANNRVIDLLEILDLRNKIFTQTQSFKETVNSPIDWDNFNNILNEERNHSFF